MSTWQPIATAPKDGTLVDLWAGRRLPDCFYGYQGMDEEDRKWRQRYAEEARASFDLHESPTHWMPIPKGPEC